MNGKEQERTIPFSDVTKGFNEFIVQADPKHAQGLDLLKTLRATKAEGLKREEARLRQTYGDKDPRVIVVATKAEVNQVLISDVDYSVTRAKTEAPTPDEGVWVLHGRVMDWKLMGLPNLTVALYDERGSKVDALGSAVTDETGYFKFTYGSPSEQPGDDEPKEGERLQDPSQRRSGASAGRAASQQRTASQVFIHVFDSKGERLYAGKDPIPVQPGIVEYREVVLGGGEDDGQGESPKPDEPSRPQRTTPQAPTKSPSSSGLGRILRRIVL